MTRDIVIVGGGIAGLAAAWRLRHRDVRLLEAGDRLGGRMRSEPRGEYWLNLGAHLFPAPGSLVDGMARERLVVPASRLVHVPPQVNLVDAACVTVTFGTVQHMLFDNAKLERGETVLVHAGGSGIGTAAIRMAKMVGAQVITTVGSADKVAKAKALGADHVINYREERFEGAVRKITGKKGVDVVFEHVGPDTWAGSLLSLKRGGRLVTCGSTSGISAETNLYTLFQQQLRIIGSFGSTVQNCKDSLAKMAAGLKPVIDTEIKLEDFPTAIGRLRSRDVFGKIVARLD